MTVAQELREHALYSKCPYPIPMRSRHSVDAVWPINEPLRFIELRMLCYFISYALENP